MHPIRHLPIWAGVILGLALLLAACAPQTAPSAGPEGTSGLAPAATQAASPANEEPAQLPASPTAPAGPTAAPTVEPTSAPTSPPGLTAVPPAASPEPIRLTPVVPVVPLPVPVSPQAPVAGEVPQDLLEAILQDAEERTGVEQAQITLLRAEAVTWRDGSLGCPQPGMMYTQALVPGYRVVLEAGGRQLDYHASESGYFLPCE
jgi:hypothetical protein